MNSLQAQYFLEVAACLSFSRAAERLYVSQPSVSYQIRALEQELGFVLFERSNKNRVTLTEAGRIYRGIFTTMRVDLQKASEDAQRLQDRNRRVLRVCIPEEWDACDMLDLCTEALRREHADVVMSVECRTFSDMNDRMMSGHADIIVCAETAVRLTPFLQLQRLAELPDMILMSKRNPLSGKPDLSLGDFRVQPSYTLPESESPMSRQVLAAETLPWGFVPRLIDCPNRASILLSLESGYGWTVFDSMNRFVCDPRFMAVPLGSSIPICAATDSRRADASAQLVIDVMRDWLGRNRAQRAPEE